MMLDGKIGIVMVNYNGEKFQNDCIETIYKSKYNNFDIIVVDNDSADNSIPLLKTEYPDVIVMEMKHNYGVAKGNNIGIQFCLERGYEYILLLNNDTEIDPDMLGLLVKHADERTVTVPKMYYYPDNEIWFAGGIINWDRATTPHIGINQIDVGQYDKEKDVEYSPTCCFLVHHSIFQKVGLMDEKYFMYYDDTDFCVRLSQKNCKIKYVPMAKLWHKVSSSSGGEESLTSVFYCSRNRLYFIDKFYKKKKKVIIFFYLSRIMKCLIWIRKGKFNHVKTLVKGVLAYRKL